MSSFLKRKGYASDNWTQSKKPKTEKDQDILSLAPREVNILEYAESHATEIKELTKILKEEPCGQNISQKLPRHMRRRAMGHDVKRLPRSVRALDKNKKAEKLNKRPSRKHRRRPKNLLAEYNRRQRKHIWLETHIWHAKRFHMVEKWGYKLPWKPTDKSSRACYRASTRHCLLQDMSYLCCIELVGEQEKLLAGLSHLTSAQTGQTFAAVSCLPGTREGHTVLYHYDNYPWNAIGPVTFMWNPSQPIISKIQNEATNERQLWIWCHPACWNDVWSELINCFELIEKSTANATEAVHDMNENSVKPNQVNLEGVNAELETSAKKASSNLKDKTSGLRVEFALTDTFKTNILAVNSNSQVQMKSLSGSLQRFRLTGPESTSVLVDTLVPSVVSQMDKPIACNSSDKWWTSFYSSEGALKNFGQQSQFMVQVGQCLSPSELPPLCVVAMTTRDPRITRPVKRTKVEACETNVVQDVSACTLKLAPGFAESPLWDEGLRARVTQAKVSDHKIHQLKSEQLVPGLPMDLTDEEARVPVIIIQRPGETSLTTPRGHDPCIGQGSGFDIVLPKGWAMPLWLALVYRGARCGGLNELENVAHESRTVLFPNSYPDTKAGAEQEIEKEKELVEKYNRVPPAKRVNYTKLNTISPFRCPWECLIIELDKMVSEASVHSKHIASGSGDTANLDNVKGNVNDKALGEQIFFVLRSAKTLRQLERLCNSEKSQTNKGASQITVDTVLDSNFNKALVPVRLEVNHRGCPGQFSMICIPSKGDLNKLEKDKNYGGPLEPPSPDPVLEKKAKLKKEMKEKGIKKKVEVDRTLKMLSEKDNIKVNAVSRKVIGYMSFGGYTFGKGNAGGLGFVAALGLKDLLLGSKPKSGPTVLVRDTMSLQYRFAKLSILI